MLDNLGPILLDALLETLYMVFCSSFIAILLGLPFGIILFLTQPRGLKSNPWLYQILNTTTNIFRSIPFIILLALLIPITRFIVGSSIGSTDTIVPLAIGAIPLMARLVQNIFDTLPKGLLEAGISLGASNHQIIMHILLPEALPALINATTVLVITIVSYLKS